MEVRYLPLSRLQRLIRLPFSSDIVARDDTIECVCSSEVLCQVERMKKAYMSTQLLQLVKNKTCQLYAAIASGYVVTADLSIDSLGNGLFEVSEDYHSFELWEEVLQSSTDPAAAVKMVSLRSFDLTWGTDLCSIAASTRV